MYKIPLLFFCFFVTLPVIYAQDTINLVHTGDKFYDAGAYKQALNFYNKANNENVNNVITLNKIAKCYISMSKDDSAFVALNKAIKLQPNYAQSYALMANLLFVRENIDSSLYYIKLAQKLKPDTAIYKVFEGIDYMYQEKFENAIVALNEAIEIDTNEKEAYYNLAFLYFTFTAKYDLALKNIDKAISLDDSIAKFYKLRSEIYFANSQFIDAIFEINKAIKLSPNNEENQLVKIEILHAQKEYKEIIDICLQNLDKGSTKFDYNIIISYFNLNMIDSALYYIELAHKKAPYDDLFYYVEGFIKFSINNYNEALICFNAAIQLNPDEVDYYYMSCDSKLLLNTDVDIFNNDGKFKDLNQANLKQIKKISKSSKSKYYYKKLLAKFKTAPTTLGFDEYFMLYVGESLQGGYSGYKTNPAISNYFEEKKYQECIDEALKFVENNHVSISSYYFLANSYFMLQQPNKALKYLTIYYGFLKSILATGDGKSTDKAFIVNSVVDEYVILRYYNYSFSGQTLKNYKKHNYDILHYNNNDDNTSDDVYFNIDLFFSKF